MGAFDIKSQYYDLQRKKITILEENWVDQGVAVNETCTIPDLGLITLLGGSFYSTPAATITGTPRIWGWSIAMLTENLNYLSEMIFGRFFRVDLAEICSPLDLAREMYVGECGQILVMFPEIDTNASPTTDVSIVLRVRQEREK